MASKKKARTDEPLNLTLRVWKLLRANPDTGRPGAVEARELITRAAWFAHLLDGNEPSDDDRKLLTARLRRSLAALNAAETPSEQRACVRHWVKKCRWNSADQAEPDRAKREAEVVAHCTLAIKFEAPDLRQSLGTARVRAQLLAALKAQNKQRGSGPSAFDRELRKLLAALDLGVADIRRTPDSRKVRVRV